MTYDCIDDGGRDGGPDAILSSVPGPHPEIISDRDYQWYLRAV